MRPELLARPGTAAWRVELADIADELLEEGNAFEAGIVAAVEDSENEGPREVRTREVPVDDVPGEYLDED